MLCPILLCIALTGVVATLVITKVQPFVAPLRSSSVNSRLAAYSATGAGEVGKSDDRRMGGGSVTTLLVWALCQAYDEHSGGALANYISAAVR